MVDPARALLFTESGYANGFDRGKKLLFLKAFEKTMSVHEAAKLIEVNWSTVYEHQKSDPVFAEELELIKQQHCDGLEDRMLEYGQKPKGFMDRIAYLRAYRPWRFREDYRGPTQIDLNFVLKLQPESNSDNSNRKIDAINAETVDKPTPKLE